MAKEISGLIKLQIRGGAANPSPPVGPALGAKGVNIMEFCKQFNARTQEKAGKVLPCVITVYADKSFDFVVKTPPAAVQLLESAKIKKGSAESNKIITASYTFFSAGFVKSTSHVCISRRRFFINSSLTFLS